MITLMITLIIVYLAIGIIIGCAFCQIWDVGEISGLLLFTIIWPILLLGTLGVKIGKLIEEKN